MRKYWPEDPAEFAALVDPAFAEAVNLTDAAARFGVTRSSLESACRTRGYRWREKVGRPPVARLVEASNLDQGEPLVKEPEIIYAPPPPPVLPVGRDLTVSLLGDLHAPEEDRPAWSACLAWHREVQPDLIVMNEMGEWVSMTKHGGNWGAMFERDVADVRRRLVQIRSVCRDARIVILETNHDTRLRRRMAEVMPQLAGRLVIPQELKLDDLGIEWVPETVPFRVGRLKVIHGHQLASNAKGQVPENACKRAVQRFGEPGWTVVFFHTHRRGYWMERHDTGILEAVNIPCLRTLAPDWTAPCPTGWTHGFGVAHVGPAGQTNLYVVDIERGAFVYGGQRFAA